MKLRAKGSYSNGREYYQAGQVFEAEPEHAAWLMRDSPGTFEEDKAVEAPPADKVVRRNRARRK
jgi:hypothetical protein